MNNAGGPSLTIPIYFSSIESRAPNWFLRGAHWVRGRVNYCIMRYYLFRYYFRVLMKFRGKRTPGVCDAYRRLHERGEFMTWFNEADLRILFMETKKRGDTENTENTEKGAQGPPGNQLKGRERGGKQPRKELNKK